MASLATCPVPGEPGMYGLGIRIGFYLQWFGFVAIQYLDEGELADIRLLALLSSAAMTLAVVVRVSMSQLQPADIYVSLLLASGTYLFLVPLYIWKGLTCCNPYWDPQRWSKETLSPIFKGSNFLLVLALSAIQVWYWAGYAPAEQWTCDQYGFFFSPVPLSNRPFVAFNAVLWLLVILVAVGIVLVMTGWELNIWSKERRRRKISKVHAVALQQLKAFSNLAVAAVMTAAVELTILWNNIPNVNWLNDAAQMICLVLSAGFVARVIFLHYAKADSDSDSETDSSGVVRSFRRSYTTSSRHTSRRRSYGGHWPPRPPPPAQRV